MDITVDRPLPGRTRQLATFERVFDAAGTALHVVVEGEPGAGKTALLRAAADLAAERGFQMAWATGREAESDRAFGVAHAACQAFEPALSTIPDRDEGDGNGDEGGDFAMLDGLSRLVRRLAARTPLLLVIDDLHWCDAASLRWIGLVVRRSAGVPLVLAAARTTGDHDHDVVLDELTEPFEHVSLGPLSECEVAAVAQRALGTAPAAAFAAAVHRVTGGHPGLLAASLADVAAAGAAPSAQAARHAAGLAGPNVDRWVRDRLRRASPYAERLVRAVGILGARAGGRVRDGAPPDMAAALAGLDAGTAAHATDALVNAGLLRHDGVLRFRQPIVRTAVLHAMSETERLLGHARAARLLRAGGTGSALVVEHLLATEPIGDPWAVPVLRAAARAALDAGAYEQAVTRLRRALAESPAGPDRLDVLVELGRAELRTNVADAVGHLTEAFESAVAARTADPRTVARIAEHLATAICEHDDAKAAIAVLDRAIARLAAGAHPASAGLVADLVADLDIFALGAGARVTSLAYAHRVERLRSRAAERPGAARAIAGILAYRLSAAGRSRRESVARAGEVLALGPPEAMRDFYAYRNAALSLIRAGELDLALRCAGVLTARGASLNQPTFAGTGHALRGAVALQAGRLADVAEAARAALDIHAALCPEPGPHGAEIFLIDTHLERGELDEAARLLRRVGLLGGGPAPYWAMFSLASRARYRMMRGDQHGALADYLEAGRQLVDCGVVNPAAAAWRSGAALVVHRLGDGAAALRLATDELTLARTWGASGPLGAALRAVGLIGDDVGALAESVAVLAGSPARLEYARSLYELGRAMLGRRQRDEARPLLREAYVVATDCGAAPLVARIGEALTRSGARRPRPRPNGVAALTTQERRVAELAAAGATNKEIAAALFLIQRTVETHLTSVYRKLGIQGRRTLAAALGT